MYVRTRGCNCLTLSRKHASLQLSNTLATPGLTLSREHASLQLSNTLATPGLTLSREHASLQLSLASKHRRFPNLTKE